MKVSNIHALFIEKDENYGYLIQPLFRISEKENSTHSIQATWAESVEQAKQHLENTAFDVILLDLEQEDSVGEEGFDRVCELLPDIPIVLLAEDEDQERALSLLKKGAQDYLIKSEITRPFLERQLRYAIERHAMLQEITIRDNTETLKMEKALNEGERRYQLLLNSLYEGIWSIDKDAYTDFVTPRMAEMLGYEVDEMIGKHLLAFIAEDDIEKCKKNIERRKEGVKEVHDILLKRKDGTTFSALIAASPVSDSRGQFKGAIAGVLDISDRVEAEKKLIESEFLYFSLVENLPQNIFRKNERGEFTFANSRFCQFVGKTQEEIFGKTDTDLFPPSLSVKFQQDDHKVLQTGQTLEVEEENITKSGEKCVVHVTKTPIFDHEGNATGVQGIFWDITEKKKLQEQFLQSQKMEAVGQLAGGVAHDFNNLLMVINSYSDFLIKRSQGDLRLAHDIEVIKKAADRAAVLIRQLLTFSRRQVMQPQVIRLREIFENMDKMLRRLIGEDIELLTVIEKDIGSVKIDPGNMEQIVMNLAVNARDAMPHGGKLTIDIKNVTVNNPLGETLPALKEGEYVLMTVTDTGVGMEPAIKRRIFEPFFTTKGKAGTGLGLSTVYGIVQHNNGVIHVYSEPGYGTSFKIYFPRCEPKATMKEKNSDDFSTLQGNETILIVEDDAEVRKLLQRGLAAYGYRMKVAKEGAEAIQLCQTDDSVDLIITDVVMPGMSGRQLMERIHSLRPNLPVLYMSGYTSEAVIRHGILEKEMPFIQKPFTQDDLLKTIRTILNQTQESIH